METMKVKSQYLNIEFDVPMYEQDLDGKEVSLVSHDTLEDIILNKIPEEYAVKYDKTVELAGRDHAVVKCTITDAKGRRVQCLGEAVTETLYSDIARGIPVTMAEIRAFDRAAIRYLGLPGKVFSRDELNPDAVRGSKPKAAPTSATVQVEEVKPDLNEELPLEKAEPAKEEVKASESTLGDTVISYGKYAKEPKTLKEIVASDVNWVRFQMKSFKPKTEEETAQFETLKIYLSDIGFK